MGTITLRAFGGMIPVRDDRLLPDGNASDTANVWLYNGSLEGLRSPRDIHTLLNTAARYVFRVPIGAADISHVEDSYWLEFENTNTTVVKSPLADSDDPMYYWANTTEVPGYTTKSRLEDGDPALVLGIPTPAAAPTVNVVGGAPPTESRSYVYTWVSEYGEEGPPSPPSSVTTGNADGSWDLTLTAPTVGDTTDRALDKVRIYRTVTNDQGTATFFFVAEQDIADTTYSDTQAASVIVGNEELQSTSWTAPPEDLQGIAAMANGMLVGWRENEIWFSEPYRPHAWPVAYQIATEYPIVAMMALDQTLIIGTQGFPYYATGTHPAAVSLRRIPAAEPCVSRGSMVATPAGVLYASPNGLIVSTPGAARNITRNYISKDRWAELLNLTQLRAGLLNEAYFVFSGVQEGVFQTDMVQADAFQLEDFTGTRDGALIEMQEERVGFVRLEEIDPTYNVIQDPWTGGLFVIRDGKVKLLDLTYDVQTDYTWTSKIFQLPKPENLGAVKITWEAPLGIASPSGTFKTYADGELRQNKTIPASTTVFRLPSGFKANSYQFEVTGNLVIKSIEVASTVKELAGA
jgi:hypothetical protein